MSRFAAFPWLRAGLILAAIVLALLGLRAMVRPLANLFGWGPARIERLRAETATAAADAAAGRLEAEGERGAPIRVAVNLTQPVMAAQAAVDPLILEARSAPDADTPLDPDRLSRLLDADRELCLARPGLAGCAAAPAAGPG